MYAGFKYLKVVQDRGPTVKPLASCSEGCRFKSQHCSRGAVSWLPLCSEHCLLTMWDMQRKEFHCDVMAIYVTDKGFKKSAVFFIFIFYIYKIHTYIRCTHYIIYKICRTRTRRSRKWTGREKVSEQCSKRYS